jgi:hypothetical protein
MCPQRFAPKSYDAAKLALLQEVFDKSWHVLELRFPDLTELEKDNIKTVLAKAIVELSVEGVFDGPELFRRSLKNVLATVGRKPVKKRKPRTRSSEPAEDQV